MNYVSFIKFICLVWVQVFYGVVGRLVLCLVVQHVVAVREGASFNILAGESDMDSIFKKRTKSKSLSHCPINLSCLNHLSPGLVDSLHSGMDYEIWGIWGSLGKSGQLLYFTRMISFFVYLVPMCLRVSSGHPVSATFNGSLPSKNPDQGESSQSLL